MEFNTTNSPQNVQGKDSKKAGNNLNPVFEPLAKADTFTAHIKELTKNNCVPHADLLHALVNQFTPVDFKAKIYPEVVTLYDELSKLTPKSTEANELQKRIGGYKVSFKQLLVETIDEIVSTAQKNRWGLCKNLDFIYLYNGAFWASVENDTFQKFLGEAAAKIGVSKYTSKHYKFREELLKQFLATNHLPTPQPDAGTVRINLQNGTFEIKNGKTKLRRFNAADFITYQLPFEYNPKATAPQFNAYLNKVLPDTERQRVLAEYLGYVFIKNGAKTIKEEKALVLYGSGANGKSVFFEVVCALLGTENTSNYSLQSLTNDNGYYRAAIANKLVNYASEINGRHDANIFKQLTSGEPVEARHPYGRAFSLTQYARLIFNCNELPGDVEHTAAYFRRFLLIPFDVTVPKEEQDKELHNKIIGSELSGVFNWVLAGLNRLLEQKGFSECKASAEAVELYRTTSDSVKMFLKENHYEKSVSDYLLVKELYLLYKGFCNDDNYKALGKQKFSKRLEDAGIEVTRKNVGMVAYVAVNENEL